MNKQYLDEQITQQKLFVSFCQNVLGQFLKEKRLKLVVKYTTLKIENDFSQYNSDGKDTKHLGLSDLQNMDNFGYETQLIEYFLQNANTEQKEIILKNKYDLFYPHSLIEATYKEPEDIKLVVVNCMEQVKLKDYFWENSVKFLQKHCDNNLYDELIDIFLSKKVSQLKVKKNKIIVNLMLNHVKNDEIYNKFNSLIPDNELANDVFESLDLNYFELNVSKEKLFSSIVLPNRDKYNSMHEFFLDKINQDKIKNMLSIFSIEGEVKYKSSKHYRYMCRVKDNSIVDKDSAKLLLMSVYKLYVDTINNVPEDKREYEVIKEIGAENIYNNYLNYKLSKQSKTESAKEKKAKI